MFKSSLKLFIIFACLGTLGLISCKQDSAAKKTDATESEAQQGKEYTSKYICPMHCEGSGSETEGTCPVCGMDYVLNENHKQDGHNHEGHDHNHD